MAEFKEKAVERNLIKLYKKRAYRWFICKPSYQLNTTLLFLQIFMLSSYVSSKGCMIL